MDIVLNEKSLDGQFTYENFCEYMRQEIIPCLVLLEANSCYVYKEYSTYSRKITSDLCFMDFLKTYGDPVVNEYKIHMHKLMSSTPYWNDSILTCEDVVYICNIQEIPNCITETYERKGILLSFKHKDYEVPFLELIRNGEKCRVSNAHNLNLLKEHLNYAGIIKVWDKNSFYINETGYKFEIRLNEKNHKIPHFHVSNADYSVSLSIPDVDILAGELPSDMKNKILSWGLKNMQHIIELWNKIHPDNIINM